MQEHKVENLTELLKKHFNEDVEIEKEEVTLLTNPGEHYGSIMLKLDLIIKIKNETKPLNLVAKKIPKSEFLQKAFDVQLTFKKESDMYMMAIPTLINFQKEFNFPEEKLLNCFPICYGTRYNMKGIDEIVDEDGVLLFENLKVNGYEMIDRHLGFDLEGCKIVISDLAKFHAVPLALRILRPEVFDEKIRPSLRQGSMQSPDENGEDIMKAFQDSIVKTVENCVELKPYQEKIQELIDYNTKNPILTRLTPTEEYGTICHSDLWVSNLMVLKDSNGTVIKNKILDFQLMNYSSGLRDLIFFLFSSVQNNVLKDNIDNFIKLYYEEFIETLKYFKINLEPYSWENFNKELENIGKDEVYHILIMLKIIFSEKGKVTNTLDNFDVSDWTRDDLIGNEHKMKMKETILALISMNWI